MKNNGFLCGLSREEALVRRHEPASAQFMNKHLVSGIRGFFVMSLRNSRLLPANHASNRLCPDLCRGSLTDI
jgi:hypothetical protein